MSMPAGLLHYRQGRAEGLTWPGGGHRGARGPAREPRCVSSISLLSLVMRETELGCARQNWRGHWGVVAIRKIPAFDLGHQLKHVSVSLSLCSLSLFKPNARVLNPRYFFVLFFR